MIPVETLRQIRRIQIRANRAVQSLVGGEYHSAFKGSGLSFEDVRAYQPGDDVRRIDWNVTARSRQPFLKRFVEERELTILLAVDFSGSLRFGSTATTKRAIAAELAALIAFAAIANGDRVGLLGFTDHVERFVPPQRGSRHAVRLLRDVLHFEPEGQRTNLKASLDEIAKRQRRRAVVFLLSDFQDAGYEASFRRAAAKHDLIAIRLSDPLEANFPNVGLIRMEDPETGKRFIVDASEIARSESFASIARKAGADLIEARTAGGHFDALVDFLRRRERRKRR